MSVPDSMIEKLERGVYLRGGVPTAAKGPDADAREKTIAYRILRAHEVSGKPGGKMRIRFDAMLSHDIT